MQPANILSCAPLPLLLESMEGKRSSARDVWKAALAGVIHSPSPSSESDGSSYIGVGEDWSEFDCGGGFECDGSILSSIGRNSTSKGSRSSPSTRSVSSMESSICSSGINSSSAAPSFFEVDSAISPSVCRAESEAAEVDY